MALTLKSTWASDNDLLFVCGADSGAFKIWKALGLATDDDTGGDNTLIDATSAVVSGMTVGAGVTFGTNSWNGTTVEWFKPSANDGVELGTSGTQAGHFRPTFLGVNTILMFSTSSNWGTSASILMEDEGDGAFYFSGGGYSGTTDEPRTSLRAIFNANNGVAITDASATAVAMVHNGSASNADKTYTCASGGTISNPTAQPGNVADGNGTNFNYLHHLQYIGIGSGGAGSGWQGEIAFIFMFGATKSSATLQSYIDDPVGTFFDVAAGDVTVALNSTSPAVSITAGLGSFGVGITVEL